MEIDVIKRSLGMKDIRGEEEEEEEEGEKIKWKETVVYPALSPFFF